MLLQVDDDHAALAWVHPNDVGLRLVDRHAAVSVRDISGRSGSLKIDNRGKLILRGKSETALIDAAANYQVHDLKPGPHDSDKLRWTAAFLNVLVDSANGVVSNFSIDRDALDLADPGYTEPTDATLLPNGNEVAITIVRSQHMAIVNFATGETRLVQLAGSYGNSHAIVEDDALWVVNYDTFCRIDLESLRVSTSPRLQAPYRHPQHGLMMSAFVGAPRRSNALNGWLVPRPYSGDILLVSKETLRPERRISCGDRPYAIVEFDGGDLLILNHPFDSFQTANVSQLVDL